MGKLPCLFRRGTIWHYRRRVPSSIRSQIGLTEITKSLHTADYSTALDRYQTVSATVEQTFNQHRQEDGYDHDFSVDTVLHKTATHATQIKAPPAYDQDGLLTLIKTVVEEVVGRTMPMKKPSITLSELYRRYMDDPARQRSKKTIMTYESVFKVLVEVLGSEKDIGEISRDDCRYVLDVIRYLPANAKKKFPKKTLVQISEIARKRKMSPMAPLTINKYISKLAAMLSWAVEEELLDHNPAKNLSVADPVHQQDKRLPFSNWQLQKMFTALEGKSGADYWVPYIGLYNGMRLNEICQLNVEDVQQHDGVWCFAITRDRTIGVDDKVLKTKASERTIPIHPQLIELGFMKYLKRFERKPRSKLFPDIPAGTTGYRSDTFSKNFRRFLRSIEADADRTSFHSFRHNFRDALREGNVRHEAAMILGGWSDSSRAKSVQMFYGKGISIKTLYAELQHIKYIILQ